MPNKTRLQFFDKDVIDWNGKYELADFYKTLLNLHSNNTALRGGDPAVSTHLLHTSTGDNVLAYLRKNENNEVLVLLNMSDEKADCIIHDEKVTGHFRNIFTDGIINANEHRQFEMQGWDYLVFEKSHQ